MKITLLNYVFFSSICSDISRGKETNPIQCVNGCDSEDKPTDFLYVTENCFTSNINVDRTITSLQSCRCEENCSSEKCLCGNISLRCWYNEEGKLVPEFNYTGEFRRNKKYEPIQFGFRIKS